MEFIQRCLQFNDGTDEGNPWTNYRVFTYSIPESGSMKGASQLNLVSLSRLRAQERSERQLGLGRRQPCKQSGFNSRAEKRMLQQKIFFVFDCNPMASTVYTPLEA